VGTAGRLRILEDDDLRRLDAAALDVLAGVGFSVPSARAREALVAAGAAADGARVTIPPGVVRELVGRAPRRLTLGARAGSPLVTGAGSLLTTDGCCVEIYDPVSGEKRATTAADVGAIARLVDAVPAVDFCWPAVSAQDRPAEVRGLHELYEAVANTGKHVQTVTVVEPPIGMLTKPMGTPAAAKTRPASSVPPSLPSGVTVPSRAEIGGSARRRASSPSQRVRAISTATAASCGSTTVTVCTCLPVLATAS
jgi:trimethylamine:corrinoid methyltransferase-like protein